MSINKALLKAVEKHNNGSNINRLLKIKSINVYEKIIYYKLGRECFTSEYFWYGANSRIYDVLKIYLQIEKIWFEESYYLIFTFLRKILCFLLKSHINVCVSDNLAKFKEICDKRNSSELFELCEFNLSQIYYQ